MKWCTKARITRMRPDGSILGLKLLSVDWVEDSHEFGLHQEPASVFSPSGEYQITVYHPVLHMEGRKAFPLNDDVVPAAHPVDPAA
jgi:hypothetical protein